MPSTPSERPSLVRRVALVGAAAAAIGGALAAWVSGAVAGRLVAGHEDDEVIAMAEELADEIVEELEEEADPDDDDDDIEFDDEGRPILASVLEHELGDVKRPGAAAALFDGDDLVAGDSELPRVNVGACVTTGHASTARRACAAPLQAGRRVVLSVSAADEGERRSLVAWALVLGALVGAGVGGALSHRSAVWAMAPVTDLRDRVRSVDPASPDSTPLRPPARHGEVEELRTAVAELVDRLGASLAHAQAFSAQAAHELRTPLSLLAGELELMMEKGRATPEDLAALERLHRVVGDLVALTQRLLILAGPGRAAGERGEPIDLSDVADTVVASLPASRSSRVSLRAAEDVVVRGDFELLRSMLHNAVDNALKFSEAAVEISIDVEAGDAVLEVRDDGPGIPALDRERVFAPFVRGPRAGARLVPGHGIGLALIAHVAEAHGGRAAFVDAKRGACLRIRLPRWRSASVPLDDEARRDLERPSAVRPRAVGPDPELKPHA